MKPTFVIIGLGNPGKEYNDTRHNIGFLALDVLAAKEGKVDWAPKQKFLADIAEASLGNETILLVKPTTYMNRSGECVRKLVDFYKLDPSTQVLVIVDDVDIPLGTHRLRHSGGPGTHNGMKSIVDTLGENFPRLRIGVGPKPNGVDLATWILSRISDVEMRQLDLPLQELLPSVKAIRENRSLQPEN